jgi:hypothetical protein
MTTFSSSPFDNLTRNIQWQANTLCRLPESGCRNYKLSPKPRIKLVVNSIKLKLVKLCGANSQVCGINGAMPSSISTLGGNAGIGQKQNSLLWRIRPRRNIHAPTLWCNPNGVSDGVNGNASNLTKRPTRLKPSTGASNLRLDIGETVCLNTTGERRILDALRLAKTMLSEKIRKQLTAFLKRPHFHWRLSDCFPLGGHKINSVTRKPNDRGQARRAEDVRYGTQTSPRRCLDRALCAPDMGVN